MGDGMTDKEHLQKPAANILPSGERLNVFPNDWGEHSYLILYWSPSKCYKVRKRNESHSGWKKEIQLSVFINDMVVFIKKKKSKGTIKRSSRN